MKENPMRASILCSLLLVACNTSNTVVPASVGGGPGQPGFQQVITNGWLNYKANVTDVREDTVSGDMKRVQVAVYSDQLNSQNFSYRFEWFDANGMAVQGAGQAWQSRQIKPKETILLTSVAPSPRATQWQLKLLDTNHPLDQ
jgi:uncharacterized protein YcfL